MKTLKYILIIVLSLGAFNSCMVDDTTRYDLNDKGPNLAGFTDGNVMISNIADGNEYDIPVKVKVIGPTSMDLTSDITLTVAADEDAMAELADADATKTPAVAGVHYKIDEPVITLKDADNYLGIIHVTMLTEGIATPTAKTPVLILKTVSAAGDPNVLNNGKNLQLTLNYACYSEFQGTYVVTHTSSTGAVFSQTEDIVKIGVEQYYTQSVGTWGVPPFTENGVIFDNSCNVLTVPFMDVLANTYSNDVFGTKPGSYDPATGVITLYYTITFAAGNRTYTAVYVPVP
jgi:hypothetical protein